MGAPGLSNGHTVPKQNKNMTPSLLSHERVSLNCRGALFR